MKLESKHTPRHREPLAREVMQTRIVSVRDEMSVEEVANILTQHQISGAPVLDVNDNVVGVVSLTDLAVQSSHPQTPVRDTPPKRHYNRDLWLEKQIPNGFTIDDYSSSMKVKDIMTPVVHQVHEDDVISDVVSLMLQARIHRVLVTNGQAIVGILTTMDLIALLPPLLEARE